MATKAYVLPSANAVSPQSEQQLISSYAQYQAFLRQRDGTTPSQQVVGPQIRNYTSAVVVGSVQQAVNQAALDFLEEIDAPIPSPRPVSRPTPPSSASPQTYMQPRVDYGFPLTITTAMKRKAEEDDAAERLVREERERTMRALQEKLHQEQQKLNQAVAQETEAVFVIWRKPPVLLNVRPAHYAQMGQIWVSTDTQKWIQEIKGFGPDKALVCLCRGL
jgi:hypothetical protein